MFVSVVTPHDRSPRPQRVWRLAYKGFPRIGRARRAPDRDFQTDDLKQRQDHKTQHYRELIGIAEEVIERHETAAPGERQARGQRY